MSRDFIKLKIKFKMEQLEGNTCINMCKKMQKENDYE